MLKNTRIYWTLYAFSIIKASSIKLPTTNFKLFKRGTWNTEHGTRNIELPLAPYLFFKPVNHVTFSKSFVINLFVNNTIFVN